jgi:hypothetical protein
MSEERKKRIRGLCCPYCESPILGYEPLIGGEGAELPPIQETAMVCAACGEVSVNDVATHLLRPLFFAEWRQAVRDQVYWEILERTVATVKMRARKRPS